MLIIRKIKGYFFAMLLGGVVGCCIYFLQPISWRSEALISIGHMASNEELEYVETQPATVERIRSRGFANSVSQELGAQVTEEDFLNQIFIRSLKDGETLVLYADAKSPEKSKALINAILTQLIKRHENKLNVRKSELIAKLQKKSDRKKQLLKDFSNEISLVNKIAIKEDLIGVTKNIENIEDTIASITLTNTLELPTAYEYKGFYSLFLTSLISALVGLILFSVFKIKEQS